MRVENTNCDRCGCSGAQGFSLFKERRADAAGGMENMYHSFDLCFSCSRTFTNSILHHLTTKKGVKSSDVVELLRKLKVEYRTE